MTSIETIKSELLDLHEEASAIFARAQDENRELTVSEKVRTNRITAEFEEKAESIKLRESVAAQGELLTQSTGRKSTPNGPNDGARQLPVSPGGRASTGHRPEATALFKNVQTGEVVHAHRGTSPIATPAHEFGVGDYLRASALNDYSSLPASLQNAASGNSGVDGGFLLNPVLSGQLVDLARSASVCLRAGAMTVPMTGGELILARVTADPQTHWRSELQTTPSSAPTFGRYTLRPKMLACLVPISLELLEDSANAGQMIQQVVQAALAQELDRACLVGAGTGSEPLGVAITSGVNEQTGVATITNYAEVTTGVRDILSANYPGEIEALSWVMHPKTAAVYDGLVTGITNDNSPLPPTPWASALRRYHTTGIFQAASPQRYKSIIGDFSQLLIGLRYSGAIMDWLDSGSVTDADSETIDAVSQFARILRIRLRADTCVMRPGFFSVMSGIVS